MRILNADDVRNLLPMSDCIDAMALAMRETRAGRITMPPRQFVPLHDDSGLLGLMPGSAVDPPVYGVKTISLHPANGPRGLPAIQGFVALFDHATGRPVALVEGATLTAIRTAAASAMATRCLARADATTHGIFGTGVQAVTHIDAVAAVRDIDRTVVFGRNEARTREFAAAQARRTGAAIVAATAPVEAAACDIVSTVTAAPEPVLFARHVRPGAHVNLVGAHTTSTREADSDLVASARVFCDLAESVFNESGDFLIPLGEGRFDATHLAGEIGAVLDGSVAGRQTADQVTVYLSLGCTAQDLVAAHLAVTRAKRSGGGVEVDW